MKICSLAKAGFCIAVSSFLLGCNGIGNKDYLVARINNENVYKEDLTMLEFNSGKDNAWDRKVYENLYAKAAVASYAEKEFPEIEKGWESYFKGLNARILSIVYQRFFVEECMMYTDSELRRFYDSNRHLFPADSTGDYMKVRSQVAGEYYIFKNAEKFAEYRGNNDGDTSASKRRFIEHQRSSLRETAFGNALERSHLTIPALPPVDPKNYYETHKEQYKTVPGYVLYHVQMSDSAALASLFGDTTTLEHFKAVAAKSSKNKLTAKDGGYVGYVKHDYPLPAGIGVVDGLGDNLSGKSVGYVTPVLRSTGEGVFQRFFLAENVAAQIKPFDRVEATIKAVAVDLAMPDVDPDFAVILKDGKPIFTEADLIEFNKMYFSNRKLNKKSHDRIVQMIAEAFAYADFAVENKLDHSWEYRALVRSTRWDYLFDRYMELKMGIGSIPEDSIRRVYERTRENVREGFDYKDVRSEAEKIAAFSKNMYNHEFLIGYSLLYKDKSLEQSMSNIYSMRSPVVLDGMERRYSAECYLKASVHFYDNNAPQYSPVDLYDRKMAMADSLYKNGKPMDAYNVYRDVMYSYPENDSLFQVVTFLMAQALSDAESFNNAEAEYYAFYRMWPDNENAEKAMFSRGFILNENLKKDSLALEVFHEFLQKYPNSELKESADWLVKNIESNGKLTEELLQKISEDQEK